MPTSSVGCLIGWLSDHRLNVTSYTDGSISINLSRYPSESLEMRRCACSGWGCPLSFVMQCTSGVCMAALSHSSCSAPVVYAWLNWVKQMHVVLKTRAQSACVCVPVCWCCYHSCRHSLLRAIVEPSRCSVPRLPPTMHVPSCVVPRLLALPHTERNQPLMCISMCPRTHTHTHVCPQLKERRLCLSTTAQPHRVS
jgi:hypothetical protein